MVADALASGQGGQWLCVFLQFVEKFLEAKATAKVLMEERKRETQEQDKAQLPAGSSSLSPTASSPAAVKSPPPTSPPSVNGHPEGVGRKISNGSGEETLRVANGPPTQQEVGNSPAVVLLRTRVCHTQLLSNYLWNLPVLATNCL